MNIIESILNALFKKRVIENCEYREWGFWTSKGWIKGNTWWQQNCE